jgi:hypothetical protein
VAATQEVTVATKPAPKNLGAAGRKMWKAVCSTYVLRPDEYRILEDACREVDLIDRLEEALQDAELIVHGSMGQPVANPLVQEIRQHRGQLRQLFAALKLPDDGTPVPGEGQGDSTGARAAAESRWRSGA